MTKALLSWAFTLSLVLCGVTPFAGLLLFMRWQPLHGDRDTPTPLRIRRIQHGQTVTLRGQTFAVDVITRDATHKRAGVQIVIDDDANGAGVGTRLHVYGADGWQELKRLIEAVEREL